MRKIIKNLTKKKEISLYNRRNKLINKLSKLYQIFLKKLMMYSKLVCRTLRHKNMKVLETYLQEWENKLEVEIRKFIKLNPINKKLFNHLFSVNNLMKNKEKTFKMTHNFQ